MKKIAGLLMTAALAIGSPAIAQQAAAPAPAAAPADADPALWVMRDADTTIYLFGTMHALRPGLSWFDEAVADAFNASSELRLETVAPDNPADLAPLVMRLAVNQDSTLTSRMTEEQRAAYTAGMERMSIPWQQLEQFDGWFVGLQLAQGVLASSGLSAAEGAEMRLRAAAAQRGIPVTTFETVEEQLSFLDSVPEAEQIVGINQMLADFPAAVASMGQLEAAWTSGNAEETGNLVTITRDSAPELHRIIFIDRNRRWAETLAARMAQPGTIFVAVGAGHLAGEGSVQTFLSQRGFTVERVAY